MSVVQYPDGNLTFLTCGVKDNNVVSYHCLPEFVIIPKKYEVVKFVDTFMSELGIVFTDYGNKYQSRMIFHVIGQNRNDENLNKIVEQLNSQDPIKKIEPSIGYT